MTTPGFGAEASVYESSRHYGSGSFFAVSAAGTSSRLIPQLPASTCAYACDGCSLTNFKFCLVCIQCLKM
jgi:hypothetical protein